MPIAVRENRKSLVSLSLPTKVKVHSTYTSIFRLLPAVHLLPLPLLFLAFSASLCCTKSLIKSRRSGFLLASKITSSVET